jgi:hypothetical protein
MFTFVCADPVDVDDPNCAEAVAKRVLDGPCMVGAFRTELAAACVWWEGVGLQFKMPVRVMPDHVMGPCLGIGPLVFDEHAVELMRAAIAAYDAM